MNDRAGESTPPATETCVGTLSADRPCARCSYNLVGQPIVREPHYGLLIARCPECGSLASLQEYPVLVRWSTRLTTVLAAGWLVAMVAGLLVTLWVLVGFSSWFGWLASERAQQEAVAQFDGWVVQQPGGTGSGVAAAAAVAGAVAGAAAGTGAAAPLNVWQLPQREAQALVAEWWVTVGGPAGFVASRGGLRGLVDWWSLLGCLPGTLLVFGLGAAWSVLLIEIPRRRLWLAALVVTVLAAAAVVYVEDSTRFQYSGGSAYNDLTDPIRLRVRLPALLGIFTILAGCLYLGMLLGRPIARVAARVLVPPRLRWGLAFLWTSEGLRPPPR